MKVVIKIVLFLFGLNLIAMGGGELYHRKAVTFASFHLSRGLDARPGVHDRIVFGTDALFEGACKVAVGLFFILLAYYYAGKPETPVSQ